jgi:very-short-patch-repair endonuclease
VSPNSGIWGGPGRGIELDGSQHIEQQGYDQERTRYLESKGFTILRFWNNLVMNDVEGVIKAILFALETH